MKNLMIAAAATLALTASQGLADGHGHKGHQQGGWHSYGAVAQQGVRVQIMCWRGPWKSVIVDKPKDIFITTLMNAGLSKTAATGVAFQVCRNPGLVNNPAGLKAETVRLIQANRGGGGWQKSW